MPRTNIATYPRSAFSQRSARGYPTIVNNIRPCLKRCLLMPLTCVVARTESTTLQLYARLGHFPRTHWHSTKQYAVCSGVLHFIRFLRALKLAIFLIRQNSPKLVPVFKSDIKVLPSTSTATCKASDENNYYTKYHHNIVIPRL